MAWFPTTLFVILLFNRRSSEMLFCDETICDFEICQSVNDCRHNEYICTDKATQCLLKCNSCRDIRIQSAAEYTEITCNDHRSCNNVQILIEEPNLDLHLECKGAATSCLDVDIKSNEFSRVECQDYDQFQCANNVNIEWISSTTSAKPTPEPTMKPTLKSTSESTLAATAKPTAQTILAVASPTIKHTVKPTQKPTEALTEKVVVTKTIFVFAKQTKSQSMPIWAIIFILFTVFCAIVCFGMIIYVKKTRKKDALPLETRGENNAQRISHSEYDDDGDGDEAPGTASLHGSPSSEIYKARLSSEGDIKFHAIYPPDAVECVVLDNSYDGLYEGNNRIFTKGNEYEAIGEDPFEGVNVVATSADAHISTIALDFEDPSLPEEMMGIGSLSSVDNLHLLYGPGETITKTLC